MFTHLLSAAIVVAATASPTLAQETPAKAPSRIDPCVENRDALANEPFVMVTLPTAGARMNGTLVVRGCSRTFERNVGWKLIVRGGKELASGHTMGGGVDGPGPFSFTITVKTGKPTLAYLEVYEPKTSDEGPPPSHVVIPVIVQ